MAIAALVGIGLSGVGIYLVWTTFAETRKANQIAWQGQRAWLYIEGIEARQYADVLVNKLQILTNITLTIRNSGNSPAITVDREAAAFSMDMFRDDEQAAFFQSCRDTQHYVVENIAPGAAAEVSFLVARGDVIDLQPESASETLTIISVSIGYEVGGSPLRHQTCQSYLVGESILPEGGIKAFKVEDLAIPRITAGKPMGRLGALHPYQGAVMT